MKTPFFIINPKNYLNLKDTLDLAKYAEELAIKYGVNIFFTAPCAYLSSLKQNFKYLKIIAQNVDDINDGASMGKVTITSLSDIGVDGVVINHAENPHRYEEIVNIIDELNEKKMISIVCCNSIKEAKAVALLNPTIILCEPTELIGTGSISDLSYVDETNKMIREINKGVLVEQAAGVKNGDDVYNLIMAGSDGTGCTSGIVKSKNPKASLLDMIIGLKKAENDRREL